MGETSLHAAHIRIKITLSVTCTSLHDQTY